MLKIANMMVKLKNMDLLDTHGMAKNLKPKPNGKKLELQHQLQLQLRTHHQFEEVEHKLQLQSPVLKVVVNVDREVVGARSTTFLLIKI